MPMIAIAVVIVALWVLLLLIRSAPHEADDEPFYSDEYLARRMADERKDRDDE